MRAVAGGKVVALVVEHVAGEPDRGERRAQLVRHVGDESLLHLRQRGEPGDLALQAGRHPVERAGQRRDHVVPVDRQAHIQLAGGEALAGLGRDLHRAAPPAAPRRR